MSTIVDKDEEGIFKDMFYEKDVEEDFSKGFQYTNLSNGLQ